MPKELLLEILAQGLYFHLALTIMVYFMNWLVVLKLGLQILKEKIGIKKIIPGVCIGVFYSLCAKQFLPQPLFGVVLAVLIAFCLTYIGRVSFIKAIWTAFIVLLIIIIGTIVIQSPLCYFYKNLVFYFVEDPFGNLVGSFIEILFPAIALFVLRTFDISLVPHFRGRNKKFDLVATTTFGLTFFVVYNSFVRVLISFKSNSTQVFMDMISWFSLIAVIYGFFFMLRKSERRMYEFELASKDQKIESERKFFGDEKDKFENEIKKLQQLNSDLKEQKIEPLEIVGTIGSSITNLQDISHSLTSFSQSILDLINPKPDPKLLSKFSDDDLRIMKMIVEGKGNKEIAAALHISNKTIGGKITKVLRKAGVEDRTQLAVWCLRNHLLK